MLSRFFRQNQCENHLLVRAKSSDEADDLMKLAKFYFSKDTNPFVIQAYAWLVKAMLKGSVEAEKIFLKSPLLLPEDTANMLDGAVPRKSNCLSRCVFIAVMLAGGKFVNLEQSNWHKGWGEKQRLLFAEINSSDNPVKMLDDDKSPLCVVIQRAASMSVYLNFFAYCFQNEILDRRFAKQLGVDDDLIDNTAADEREPLLSGKQIRRYS